MPTKILRRIRAIREQKGLSAADVAKYMGISRPFYTLIEGGKRRLTVDHLERIAGALGMTVSEIYDGIPGRRSKEATTVETA